MARPTKMTPQRCRAIAQAVRAGATLKAAATAAGISYDTLADWRRNYPEFAALLAEAEGDLQTELAAVVIAAATGRTVAATGRSVTGKRVGAGDPDLALRMLSAKWPEAFGRRRVEVTGAGGGPVEHEDVSYRTKLRERLDELAARRARKAAERDAG